MRRGMEGGGRLDGGEAGGRRFSLDRSNIRVLLCDKDPKSSQEVLRLLNNCSYQVTTVSTARQVIDLLTNGNEIDIVLCEVDLPIAKGLKMLKCIARKKDLRHIPIIMMSSRDEVSVVARCLRLGAADYLVKPLRTNELLNLWTHSWRRRHMLGQAEKDIFNQRIGMIFSDHSDASTNSTTFLSEDTDDKIRTRHQELTLLDQKDHEFDESRAESDQNILSEEDNALQHSNHPVSSGKIFSWPTKMDLKMGQSSAFITYVKSRAPTSHLDRDATPSDLLNGEENLLVSSEDVCDRSMLQDPKELPVIVRHTSPSKHLLPRTEGQIDVPGVQPMFHVPFYLHGHPSSMQGVQGTLYDLPQSHHSPMMQHFAYYPVPISFPSGHNRPLTHLYSSCTTSHMPQSTNGLAERRAAALMKFKQKKKERCYDKKIRYINRKRLAEKRPRVRGQFVRQVNDVDVQLNDSPAMNDYDSDEEEDEPLSREDELDSSPEHDTY
ncbi:hypothetical protein KFK09_001552 [Dendrobium nobile]|uniref:Two-component response regulator-like APRR1 n=1 Tax=Dendrobium nobile TaxID=94219 RepID=A0A8T3C7N7_DENNO|nr:hypothetical protein KFK09_001552 [Dendrobium nobile]